MPQTYDLYVTDTVIANAMAIGSQNPIVVVGTPLLGRLGPGEQRALLAHEVAHILSDHMLYTTALADPAARRRQHPVPARDPGGGGPRRAARVVSAPPS